PGQEGRVASSPTLNAYPRTAGDCPNFAESSEPGTLVTRQRDPRSWTVPFSQGGSRIGSECTAVAPWRPEAPLTANWQGNGRDRCNHPAVDDLRPHAAGVQCLSLVVVGDHAWPPGTERCDHAIDPDAGRIEGHASGRGRGEELSRVRGR